MVSGRGSLDGSRAAGVSTGEVSGNSAERSLGGVFPTASDGDLPCGAGAFASEVLEGHVCFWAEVEHPNSEPQMAEFYLTPEQAEFLADVLRDAANRVRALGSGIEV